MEGSIIASTRTPPLSASNTGKPEHSMGDCILQVVVLLSLTTTRLSVTERCPRRGTRAGSCGLLQYSALLRRFRSESSGGLPSCPRGSRCRLARRGCGPLTLSLRARHAVSRADLERHRRLAERHGYSASGLARRAGLDATSFNRSKRIGADGRKRWPSTESVSKVLAATGASLDEFLRLIEAREIPARPHGPADRPDPGRGRAAVHRRGHAHHGGAGGRRSSSPISARSAPSRWRSRAIPCSRCSATATC